MLERTLKRLGAGALVLGADPLVDSGRLQLYRAVGHEVGLAGAANRADPVVGDGFKGGAGSQARIGVSHGGVVDHAAHLADPQAAHRLAGLTGRAFALQGFEGNAVAIGVVVLYGCEQAEVAGRGAEDAGVLLGLADLLVELRFGAAVAVTRAWAANSGYIVVYS